VVFDLAAHDMRPGPEEGYAACEVAAGGVPQCGLVGAGAGTAVGKALGRERATPGGVGYAAGQLPSGTTITALAVANAAGDVLASNGEVIGGPHDDDGRLLRSADLIPTMEGLPEWTVTPEQNTTLVCVCTDASLDKRSCAIIARMASAGVARAVDPTFSPIDGDVVFCLASGRDQTPGPGLAATWALAVIGTVAANVVAEAIRGAVIASTGSSR
jgi:L-aminopeptidase/D-esterase-like protein